MKAATSQDLSISSRSRRGLTLIEILIATAILAAVVIPVATLIMGGLRRTEGSKHSAIAMAMAANIMDELLSPSLPFGCFDPKGESSVASPQGKAMILTLPSIGKGRPQATFRDFGGVTAARCEKVLNDKPAGGPANTRIKVSDEGLQFEVFLFAGVYEDKIEPKADLKSELTFSYLPNPYLPSDPQAAGLKILGPPAPVDKLFPYTRVPEGKVAAPVNIYDYNPGWPKPPSGLAPSPTQLKEDISKVYDEFDAKTQKAEYFAFFEDQRKFGKPGGGLMKLVLGVRWNPNVHIGPGVGFTRNSREIWLVSFKADLLQH
ncbi:MAG: prepilin-type N-terminal cleavage/methylation domain-containing protein [Candidatus Riflebacteria bacterium]|nr:prepilin-type N-terminal cleavage/methylation domain-containing protein [Candidatus Riflebacteria bacterium]